MTIGYLTHPEDQLRPMIEQDLPLVLAWRNHPEVRRHMLSTHEISTDEHRGWFERAIRDPARHMLIYEQEFIPLGFVNLHLVDPAAGLADWGFYVSPGAPRGTGVFLGKAVTRYVFGELGVQKLCGKVLKFNERSLRFHLRLGFQQDGVLLSHHFDGSSYQDMLCFGLHRNEWAKNHE